MTDCKPRALLLAGLLACLAGTSAYASGHVVQTLSVDNPRLVTIAGSKDPGTAALDGARLALRLPSPDTIRIVEVLVRSGPNERGTRSFAIPPSDKPR